MPTLGSYYHHDRTPRDNRPTGRSKIRRGFHPKKDSGAK